MTKEITKAFIIQQIQDKFKLRELSPEKFTFSEQVVPTYEIGSHLKRWEVLAKTVSITSATNFTVDTVPETEQWTLRGYMFIFYGAGAYKISGLYIIRPAVVSNYIYLDLEAGHDKSYIVNLPAPVVLHSGTEIHVLVDTYVSTQNLGIYFDVMKEEIR